MAETFKPWEHIVDTPNQFKPWEKLSEGAPAQPKSDTGNKGATIFRQGEVFKGRTGIDYEHGGMSNPKNQEIYESIGEPLTIFGMPVGDIRIQKTSVDGEERTQFVPKAVDDTAESGFSKFGKNPIGFGGDVIKELGDNPAGTIQNIVNFAKNPMGAAVAETGNALLDALGGGDPAASDRILQGAGLEAMKGTIQLGFLLAKLGQGDEALSVKAIKKLEEDFNKNFPTMPAGSPVERMAQEILSFIVGYGGGKNVAKVADPDLPKSVINFLSKAYTTFRKIDPVTAKLKVNLLIKSMLIETAGNVGGTVTSPENIESFSKSFGLPGTDENDKLGVFIDNMAMSAGMAGLAKMFGLGKNIWDKFRGRPVDAKHVAYNMLSVIDNGINENTPVEELERRINILDKVLASNDEFRFAFLDKNYNVKVDTSNTLIRGVDQYMREVYTPLYEGMPPNMLEAEIATKADIMMNSMIELKRGYAERPEVKEADANMVSGFTNTMTDLSDNLAKAEDRNMTPAGVRGQASINIGQPVADTLNRPKFEPLNTIAAEETAKSEANKNKLMQLLVDAQNKGVPSDLVHDDAMAKIGEDLYNNRRVAWDQVNKAFESVPQQAVDYQELANVLKQSGDYEGIMGALGLAPNEPGLATKIGDDAIDQQTGALISPVNDLATELEKKLPNLTLKDLVRKVRPLIAIGKDTVMNPMNTRVNKDTGAYDILLDYIDNTAKNAGPEFAQAMDTYIEFMLKYENTAPLRAFGAAADNVRPRSLSDGTILKPTNYTDMKETAMQSFVRSKDAFTRDQLKEFLQAAATPTNSTAISTALIGKAINQLVRTKAGGEVKLEELIGAVEPLLKTLEETGDTETVKAWNNALEIIQMNKSGLQMAKEADDKLLALYEQTMDKARTSAASEFVTKLSGSYIPKSAEEANQTFKRFFDAPNLVSRLDNLINDIKANGDELAMDGLKSSYIKWMVERIMGTAPIGSNTIDGAVEFARTPIGSQIIKMSNAKDGDVSFAGLRKLFSDEPEVADVTESLIKVMADMIDLKNTKGIIRGSDTANNLKLQDMLNTMITLGFGVLNRTATTLRTFTKIATVESDKMMKQEAERLVGKMIADPSFFREAINDLSKDLTGKTFVQRFMNTGLSMSNALLRGTYTSLHGTKDQTQEAIPME